MEDAEKHYVLYDGECGFCNFWVQWILDNDKADKFRFAPLQGDFGQKFLAERNLSRENFNTIYLWKPTSYYLVKSTAVLEIAKILGGKYTFLAKINPLPAFLSDKIYDKIAENRRKLSGKCRVLSEKEKKKFLD